MEEGRVPLVIAVVALLAAMVAAFVLGTEPRSARGAAAAQSFLTAWERSRTATFVVHADFVRTLPDGNQLHSTTTTVQRPPDDRLIIGLGSVAGRLGGNIVRCAAAPEGVAPCVTGGPAPDYRAEVDGELEGLRTYLLGDRPLYTVIDFGGSADRCFRLDLAVALPSPPYGDQTLFCFDGPTGAPVLVETDRPEALDRTVARDIRPTVTPDDLRIPDDRGVSIGTTVPGSG